MLPQQIGQIVYWRLTHIAAGGFLSPTSLCISILSRNQHGWMKPGQCTPSFHNNYIPGFEKKIKCFHDYGLWLVDNYSRESPLGNLTPWACIGSCRMTSISRPLLSAIRWHDICALLPCDLPFLRMMLAEGRRMWAKGIATMLTQPTCWLFLQLTVGSPVRFYNFSFVFLPWTMKFCFLLYGQIKKYTSDSQ